MKFSVYTALLVAALVGLSSGQQDCAYPTGSDVKNIISQNIIFPTEDNSSTLTIKVSSIHLVCLAHSVERDRYRFISFLAQYSCSGNVNCPSGIVLEQFESECIREWSHVVLGSTEYTRTTDPIANISTSTREDCAFCISPTHSFTVFGLPTDPLTHCSACHSSCNETTGLMQCFGQGSSDCCNFYHDSMCVDQCPSPFLPNTDNDCVCPVGTTGQNCTELIDCGPLEDPAYGMVSVSATTYTSVANYSCHPGFNLTEGDIMRTCQSSGLWSGSIPTCTFSAFFSGPADVTLEYSDTLTATFSCTVLSSFGCVDWHSHANSVVYNGNETLHPNGSITSVLTVTNLGLQHSGTTFECHVYYDCRYNDPLYSVATVWIVPAIIAHPESQFVRLGDNVSLSCTAYGGPLSASLSLTFNWKQPNLINSPTQEFTENDTVTSTLSIDDASSMHDGNYSCSVAYSNMTQVTATSLTATLTILSAPSILQPDPMTTITVVRGETVTLSCIVSTDGMPAVFWQAPSGQLVDTESVELLAFNIIFYMTTISNVTAADGGNYTCIAENEVKRVESSVVLYISPYISSPLVDVNTENGSYEIIECLGESFPPLTSVHWEVLVADTGSSGSGLLPIDASGASEYPQTDFITVSVGNVLEFNPVVFGDGGVYRCVLTNGRNTLTDQITITVAPVISEILMDTNVTRTDILQLTCSALGFPTLYIEWYHNGSAIHEDERTTISNQSMLYETSMISVTNTTLDDSGEYTCIASNDAGTASTGPVVVLIQDRPEKPTNVEAVIVTSRSLSLEWVEPYHNNAPVLGYRVMYSQQDIGANVEYVTEQETLQIASLLPGITYQFTVVAYNDIGDSAPSDILEITTLEEVPATSPTGLAASTINSTSIEITWEPVRLIDQNGIITQYEVEYVASMFSTIAQAQSTLPSLLMITLTGLEEYVQYSIRVRAYTAVGAGPFSQPVVATTLEDVPASPPASVGAFPTSSSSIQVLWDEVPAIHRNGIIIKYEVEFAQSGDGSPETMEVTAEENVLDLSMLEDFAVYVIRVRAYTTVGPGPYSASIIVAEEQDVPTAPPTNVNSVTLSMSAIQVMWDEVPIIERNGIITRYEVEYNQTAFSEVASSLLESGDAPTLMKTLNNLHEYTEYSIRVRAYTVKGPGPYSNTTLTTTLQDKPSAPPQNIVITSLSSTSLHIMWDPVPPIHQNGIITHYDVEYNQSTFSQVSSSLSQTVSGDIPAVILNGLEEYVIYSVRVKAYTSIGEGPYSSPENKRTLEDVPSGYPINVVATPFSPTAVRVQWGPVSAIDRNGVISQYEVLFNQSTVGNLLRTNIGVNNSDFSAVVSPLQPFITYTISVRAVTSVGHGPLNPSPLVTMTDPSGLTLTIPETDLVVKEGEDMDITCSPSSPAVALEWDIPVAASSDGTVVSYNEPLRHTLTNRNANLNHEGTYTCRVVGDSGDVVSAASASVKVREKCLEDFVGGLFWNVAFDGDIVSRPCRNIDSIFSIVVKVRRGCMSRRRWTAVDYSGCTLSSNNDLVFVIISLWATVTSTSDDNDNDITVDLPALEGQLISLGMATEADSYSLELLSQSIAQYTLLLFKVSYTTVTEAQGGNLHGILCHEDAIMLGSDVQVVIAQGDITAVTRSDSCECRQVLQTQEDGSGEMTSSAGSGGVLEPQSEECSVDLDIQKICNGTLASPCDCDSTAECLCVSPYVGDGSLCVLDSDGDGYPNQALETCTEADTQTYCSADTCRNAPNIDQRDTRPCNGSLMTDCPANMDEVWNIHWPFAPAGTTVTVSCGVDFVGNATRQCQTNLTWDPPDVTNCQSRVFVDIMERADIALNSADAEQVLEVVGDLVQATAAEDMAQLPQDLDTTNDIITNTLDLLIFDLDQAENDTNATTVDATVIFEALDNILSESNQVSFDSLQEMGEEGSQTVLKNVEIFGLYAARVLDRQMGTGQTVNITGDNMALRAQSIAVDENTEYSFPSMREIAQLSLPNASLANISLPSALLTDVASGQSSVVIASVLFTTLQAFLPSSSSGSVRVRGEAQSLVISSQVASVGKDGKMTNLMEDNPVIINFEFQLGNMEDNIVQCVFWDFGNSSDVLSDSGWSVGGVTTEKVTILGDSVTVQCSSLHLTSFACLVDVGGAQDPNKALNVVSYIGLSISLICLFFTIIFYLTFGKKLFSAVHNFVHLNLAIALFIGYLVFTVGVELAAKNEIGCKAVTALIQYFFLSAFCWMMCEGVMLYLMLVMVFSTLSEKWWFFLLLGWGIPVIFVVIGLGSVHDQYGVKGDNGDLQYCWLSSGNGTYAIWTFAAPMLAIIIINVAFLLLVLRSIYKSRMGRQKKKEKREREVAKSLLKASLILLPLLGLTWVFGLFAVNENTAVFAWLFTIFNSMQGFFVFFFHVVRSEKVSRRMKKKYSIYSSSVSRKLGTLSGTLRKSSIRPGEFSLRQMRGSKSISVSETESEWKSESIIIRSPLSDAARSPLPTVAEGKEIELMFGEFGDSEYGESEFGDEEMEPDVIVKVNLSAIDVQ